MTLMCHNLLKISLPFYKTVSLNTSKGPRTFFLLSVIRVIRTYHEPTKAYFLTDQKSEEYICVCRVSQEECARLREGVPYVKVYRYNPKHLCPKFNGYGDNGQRSLKL